MSGRRPTVSALLLTLAPLVLAQEKTPAEQTPTPVFPAQVDQVIVDVVVVDKKGNPITDLRQEEITVSEDGNGQAIASFERVQLQPAPAVAAASRPPVSTNQRPENRTGRSFVILFDDVHLTPAHAQRAKQAVASFLETGTSTGDLITLVASGGGAWWTTRMPQGRGELVTLLKRLDGRYIPDLSPERMSDYEAMMIHVFRDTRTMERVARRYETFGINPGSRGRGQTPGSSAGVGIAGDPDPLVAGRAAETYYGATSRNRVTLDAIERLLASLRTARGRKSMILVSEGFIYDPNLSEFKDVVQAARRANVAIYFLDTRGLSGLSSVYQSAEFGPALDTQDLGAAFLENLEASEGAESIASDSGGFTVKNTNDLSKGIQRIATESSSYYLVGYVPQNAARDGKFRKISVKVARKDIQVRARKGYYAPQDGAKPKPKKPGPDPVLQTALDSPFEEDALPLRRAAYVFDETLLGKLSTLLAADVDIKALRFEEKEGRQIASLDVLLVAAHRESGEYFQYSHRVDMKLTPPTRERLGKSWYPLIKDFELPPGAYQAKLVVREVGTNRIGTVIHEFEVPEATRFRTSTPVVTDSLQQPAEGSKERPRPVMLARRNFPLGSPLYCSLEVYGAKKDQSSGMPRVVMGYAIKNAAGETVVRRDATLINPTSLGKLSRMVGEPLEGAAAGDYEMVISVRDELASQSLELREPFSLVPPPPAVADKPATP